MNTSNLSGDLNPIRQENLIGHSMAGSTPLSPSHSARDSRTDDVATSQFSQLRRSNYIEKQRNKLQQRFDRELSRKMRDFKQREIYKSNESVSKLLNFRKKTRENVGKQMSATEIADLRKTCEDCKTGLIHALQSGNTEALKIYCKVTDINYINESDIHGFTPLMLAASTHPENVEALKILLEHGAEIHAVDDKGMMAIDYLEESLGYTFLEELEENDKSSISIIQKSKELLLQAGCKTCGKDLNLYQQAREEWRGWKRVQEFTEPLYRHRQNEEDGSWQRAKAIMPRDTYRWVFNHIHADQKLHPQSNQHVNPELTFQEVNELLLFCKIERLYFQNDKNLLETGSDLINRFRVDWKQNALGKAMSADPRNELESDDHPVKGRPHLVNILLKAGANTEIINEKHCYYTPLMHAVLYKQKHILKKLLDAGDVNRNARTTKGDSALMVATSTAINSRDRIVRHEILKTLLNDPATDKELRNNAGETALLATFRKYDVRYNPYETVKLLLNSGVDIRAQDQKGNTLLMLAIQMNHLEVAKLLLFRDPGVSEIANNQGYTPLMLAIRQHNLPLLRILLQNGVSVDAKDKDGNTALMQTRDINVMKRLLSPVRAHKSASPAANINAQNNLGETALTKAIKWAIKNHDLEHLEDHLEVIKFLIDSGANIKHINPLSGRTPLAYTNPDVVTMMGGDPDSIVVKEIRQLLADRQGT